MSSVTKKKKMLLTFDNRHIVVLYCCPESDTLKFQRAHMREAKHKYGCCCHIQEPFI